MEIPPTENLKDGIWLNAIVSHIGSYKFVYLYQDITSKKQLERQLKKHHNELENLVKVMMKFMKFQWKFILNYW